MKTIFRLILLTILIISSDFVIAQNPTVVKAYSIDANSDGKTDAIEFEFDKDMRDSDFDASGYGAWDVSTTSDFSSNVVAINGFSTNVSVIATETVANDKYIRLTFNPGAIITNTKPIYFRYIDAGGGSDDIYESTGTDKLLSIISQLATDKAAPKITSVNSDATLPGVLKVGQTITFTIDVVGIENGLTVTTDTYNGKTLTWNSLDFGDTYVGIYTVIEGDPDQPTPIQLTGVTLTDASSNISSSVSGTNVAKTIDANTPVINSVTSNATGVGVLKVGESIVFTVDIDVDDPNLTITPLQYNGEDLNWIAISGGNTYQGTYTVTEGNDDQTTALQLTGVKATDPALNNSNIVDGIDVVKTIDAHTPVINSVTSDANPVGKLKVGNSITFTLDVATSESGLTVSPTTYNGRDLNWSTSNGGDTYVGTYTIIEGDNDQSLALQLTGVTLTDSAGNVSDPKDGIDVAKTIDAHTPQISTLITDATTAGILKIGQSIHFTIDVVGLETGLIISPNSYNGRSLDWTTSDLGDTYVGTYTVTNGDTDQPSTLDLNGVTASDNSGNTSISKDVVVKKTIDANTPVINSVTSNATAPGILKVGNSITFTADIATAETGLIISPSTYNGRVLNWTTSDGGSTYNGTYTVTENDPDISVALQLTGVIATDPAGNPSNSKDGSDVLKTIDAHTPFINSVTSNATGSGALKVGESIIFTVDINVADPDLTITPLQYNGQNLGWTAMSGGDSYQGTYTVTEGDPDRTTALQLTGVTATDPAGNVSIIVNGSDVVKTIDANTPFISSVTSDATTAGKLKIGDKITFTVDVLISDGTLNVSPSTYNGRALNWYTGDGGNTYKGIYTVTSGDPNQSTALQLTGVTLTDLAGNISNSKDGSDILKTIDANFPIISSVLLKDKSKKIGDQDTLYITINSDTEFSSYTKVSGTIAGYAISTIQPINSTTINAYFTITARTYEIDSSETVQISNLQLADGAGNFSNIINSSISNDKHAIFSRKPSAFLSGSASICDNDSIEIPVFLSGHAPFSFTYYTNNADPVTINSISSSLYKLKIFADISSGITQNYTIKYVKDATGNENTTIVGPFTLTVNSLPNAIFLSPTNGNTFDISIETVNLSASPGGTGGVFSGNAVIPAYKTFNPKLAGVGFHNLYYNYTDANGCKDADNITVEVIEGGTIYFSQGKEIYCSYTDTFSVVGFNNLALTGSFTLEDDPGGALLDNGDNTALIYPSLLEARSYNITYSYGTAPVVNIIRSFSVEEVSNTITFNAISNKCEDYSQINVEAKNLSPLGGTGYFVLSDPLINLHKTNN